MLETMSNVELSTYFVPPSPRPQLRQTQLSENLWLCEQCGMKLEHLGVAFWRVSLKDNKLYLDTLWSSLTAGQVFCVFCPQTASERVHCQFVVTTSTEQTWHFRQTYQKLQILLFSSRPSSFALFSLHIHGNIKPMKYFPFLLYCNQEYICFC